MLFKSLDRGNTWSTLYPALEDIIAIHTQGDHAEEVVVTRDSVITRIIKMAIDPDNPRKLFLLVERTTKSSRELLVSEDAGLHWKVESVVEFEADNVFIDPTSPADDRTIYLTGKHQIQVRKNGDMEHH